MDSVVREEAGPEPIPSRVVVHMRLCVGLSEGEDGWENIIETRAHYVLVAKNSHNVLSENCVGRGKEGGWGGRGGSVDCYYRIGYIIFCGVDKAGACSGISSELRPKTTEGGLRFGGSTKGRGGNNRNLIRFMSCFCIWEGLRRLQPSSHTRRKLLLQGFRFHTIGWNGDRKRWYFAILMSFRLFFCLASRAWCWLRNSTVGGCWG